MTSTNLIEDLRLLGPPGHGDWWLLILAGVCATVCFLLLRNRRRRGLGEEKVVSGPELWRVALEELERLTPLLSREHCREYAIQSTGIVRRYVEARYGLHAPRLATEEFLVSAMESPALPLAHRAGLGRFLELCDLLKFGRYLAATAELEPLHTAAVEFVLTSRPVTPAIGGSERPG